MFTDLRRSRAETGKVLRNTKSLPLTTHDNGGVHNAVQAKATCGRASRQRGSSNACAPCSSGQGDGEDMRISHGRARVEEHDAPEAGQLERSLPVFRHLRSEGSGMSRAELRDRDGKRKLCVHPPIRAVPSQRDAHHFQSASRSKQACDRASFRSVEVRRAWRGQARPECPARSPLAPLRQL